MFYQAKQNQSKQPNWWYYKQSHYPQYRNNVQIQTKLGCLIQATRKGVVTNNTGKYRCSYGQSSVSSKGLVGSSAWTLFRWYNLTTLHWHPIRRRDARDMIWLHWSQVFLGGGAVTANPHSSLLLPSFMHWHSSKLRLELRGMAFTARTTLIE
jgi:hypothetical protein